jgi:hypothetical protein
VVSGLKPDEMRGLDGRSWYSSAESLKEAGEKRSGARMRAMLKKSTKPKRENLESARSKIGGVGQGLGQRLGSCAARFAV